MSLSVTCIRKHSTPIGTSALIVSPGEVASCKSEVIRAISKNTMANTIRGDSGHFKNAMANTIRGDSGHFKNAMTSHLNAINPLGCQHFPCGRAPVHLRHLHPAAAFRELLPEALLVRPLVHVVQFGVRRAGKRIDNREVIPFANDECALKKTQLNPLSTPRLKRGVRSQKLRQRTGGGKQKKAPRPRGKRQRKTKLLHSYGGWLVIMPISTSYAPAKRLSRTAISRH